MEDLRKLIDLNKKFSKGRDVIDEIAKAKKGGDEGLLGKQSDGLQHLGELLLFDSDI